VEKYNITDAYLQSKQWIKFKIAQYANERKQFGQSIGSFGAIKNKLANMASYIYASESVGYRASQNIDDAKRHGTFPMHENRPGAKLTKEKAITIVTSTEKSCVLAEKYGVTLDAINAVRQGRTWIDITEDFIKTDYYVRGNCAYGSKLTDNKVLEIFNSTEPNKVLANKFGVSCTTIKNIRSGKTWKHITKK